MVITADRARVLFTGVDALHRAPPANRLIVLSLRTDVALPTERVGSDKIDMLLPPVKA